LVHPGSYWLTKILLVKNKKLLVLNEKLLVLNEKLLVLNEKKLVSGEAIILTCVSCIATTSQKTFLLPSRIVPMQPI
jgi:hypothetical protein